jgi:hypothetical protein
MRGFFLKPAFLPSYVLRLCVFFPADYRNLVVAQDCGRRDFLRALGIFVHPGADVELATTFFRIEA